MVDHKMRDLLLDLAPAFTDAQLRDGVGHDGISDLPAFAQRVELACGFHRSRSEHDIQCIAGCVASQCLDPRRHAKIIKQNTISFGHVTG